MPLGYAFNAVQCFVLLALMAQITGHKAGMATHHIVNAHIYENQVEGVKQMLEREPFPLPCLAINELILSLEDIETWVSSADFQAIGYTHHKPISFPFTV